MQADKKFAKIFVVDGEQVLFYLAPDTEDGNETAQILHQIVCIEGIHADVAGKGIPYDSARELFDKLDANHARDVLEVVRNMVKSMQLETEAENFAKEFRDYSGKPGN